MNDEARPDDQPPGGSLRVALRPARQDEQSLIKAFIRGEHLNPLSLNWRHFWLAEAGDGEVVGCGQVKTHRDGSRELASLVVGSAWRGRGIGAALIGRLKAEAGQPLWLTCRSGLTSYYAKFGFQDATRAEDLPPYFRRIRRVAEVMMRLAGAREQLSIMVWRAGAGSIPTED
jgi:N-acetylglutamate synthase-like GNAT family acetyltransferase